MPAFAPPATMRMLGLSGFFEIKTVRVEWSPLLMPGQHVRRGFLIDTKSCTSVMGIDDTRECLAIHRKVDSMVELIPTDQ